MESTESSYQLPFGVHQHIRTLYKDTCRMYYAFNNGNYRLFKQYLNLIDADIAFITLFLPGVLKTEPLDKEG